MLIKRGVSLAIISAFCISSIRLALAMSPNTNSTFYFDENGQLVGQSILMCNGTAEHGGNVHTAYYIETSVSCGFPTPAPPAYGPTPYCVPGSKGCSCEQIQGSTSGYYCPTGSTNATVAPDLLSGGGGGGQDYIVAGAYIVAYVLPSFETVPDACSQIQQCQKPPERILNLGWTWYVGYQ